MKKLLTISAVVFLMIFTAGLATAKTVGPTFPFTGTGDVFSVSDTGVVGTTTNATITVNEASNGLFWGTLVVATTPATTIDFSAVLDSQGVYTFNGVVFGSSPVVPVTGAFIITKEKEPGVKHKDLAAAIQYRTVGFGESWAGILFH